VENKKINALFGFVVIAFLAGGIILVKDFRNIRSNDYQQYSTTLSNILRQKSIVINSLANRLAVEIRENQDLKNTLAETRNDLDLLSKKLSQQAPAPAPAAAVAAAQPPAAAASK
jgi:hypothetical protein